MERNKIKKITAKTRFNDIFDNENAMKELIDSGMHCFGCPMAHMETIEQGAKAHGMSKKDVDKLVEKLNKKPRKK